MKLIVLGSGTSTGVPRLGGETGIDWGACDPDNPKNRRSRVSIVVENDEGSRLLVDTSPDLRSQLLATGIAKLDAVFWTHDHADHCHGIDDLRPLRYGRGGPIPGFAADETVRRLRQRFGYVFAGQHGYPTIVSIETLENLRMFAGFSVQSCQMPHGPAQSTGFRFECDGKSICYATDFSEITRDMVDLFSGCDILVVDCLRREPHPTHANLGMAIELADASRARRAVLTHLDKSMDYAILSDETPDHVLVGHDGMELAA
ncbi:phosphoribosyl 1,2-cyclic phosphodiesterase [Novosphingobium marinum]|uniref:Phosphoribosyl 1,2-cyclic phosphate phosphodiesterase n=1 Tax=Novosphingobium marinum TaxID=1514948 RepID=A0A7Y9XWA0_9SPHN|nr:MBL fold metallo-hydrolase [Novosphingobium marinum]NYH94258.1 phosphoribosyl 1,2-cyclic phosphate phosphodiesterase [Novosphingobium marinum]GGC20937.1 phosphoribosyl 1,2-cyclic phosphodiesterase [Novosphingobium marinum]